MEQKVVIFLSSFSMLAMGACIAVMLMFPGMHTASLALQESDNAAEGQSVLAMLRDDSQLLQMTEEYVGLEEHQIRLEIPSSVDLVDIELRETYMTREIFLSIPGVGDTYFYDYPMVGSTEGIEDMRYEVHDRVGVIDITMNHVYECVLTEEKNYLYLDFKRPQKVYDYVVAIDAGHGSNDPGAIQGDVFEKDITLAMELQLKKLFDKDKHNIGVYYTRLDDSNPDLRERVGLSNDIKADAFVSIHINSTDSGRLSGIRGTSVMYVFSDKSGKCKALAESCLGHLLDELGSESKGFIPGDNILILRTSKAPAVLCEIGFLTNPEEKALMMSKPYQKKVARALYQAILENLGLQ